MQKLKCPACDWPCESNVGPICSSFNCSNCGTYRIEDGAMIRLKSLNPVARASVSHMIYKRTSINSEISYEFVENAAKLPLPNPMQQLNLLIMRWGDEYQGSAGQYFPFYADKLRAAVGAVGADNVVFLKDEAVASLLVSQNRGDYGLTMRGWELYEELKKGRSESKRAFMAMQFRDNEPAIRVVNEYFKPAVAQTGFTLEMVNDVQKAGLIDDKIAVDIRNSKFVVADLTKRNDGAYWEAGFATGLGKHVFYTCEKSFFHSKDPDKGTHFDCNHHQTTLWTAEEPELAAEELKAAIRNTLLGDAIQEDPPESK